MTTTNTAITSVIPTDNSLTNQTSTNHISPIAVPSIPAATVQSSTIIQPTNKITLKQVHQDLEQKEISNDRLQKCKGALLEVRKFLHETNFRELTELIDPSTLFILSELRSVTKILSQKSYKKEFKPLIKLLFELELSKFSEAELADGAVIMRTLIKIDGICDAGHDALENALKTIIKDHKELSSLENQNTIDQNDIAENCQIIKNYLQSNNESLDLMTLLYKNEELDLVDPFKARHVDDDSSEEHGFFASLKYAFLHPIEFVKETIWGKNKPNGSPNAVHEIESQYKTSSEGQGSAIKYFEDAIKWLFNLGGLFSTHERDSNITTADTPPLEPAGKSDTEGEEGS